MKFSWRGATTMAQRLLKESKESVERIESALYTEAQIEVTEMKRRTPVDTTENAPHPGLLRDGIHAEEPVRNGRNISVTVATSAQTPYDVYVHENPDAIHPIGQWKFMESVINESRGSMAGRVAARLKKD